jgi:membrane protein
VGVARDAWTATRQRLGALVHAVDRRLPDRVGRLVRRVADGDIVLSASSLAFYGLISVLPMLLIAFAAVEAVAGREALDAFVDQVSETGPDGTTQFLEQLAGNNGGLTTATLLFTIWPATAYGGGLRRALSRHTGVDEVASGLRGRLLGLGLVLALPVLVLAGIPLMFFLTTLSGDGTLATAFGWTLALGAGGIVGTALATVLYRAFAPGQLRLRETVHGAGLTAVVTAIFSLAFVIYFQVGTIEDRFGGGTIAVVVLIGLWLFVANNLLLAGYEAVLELVEEEDPEPATSDD